MTAVLLRGVPHAVYHADGWMPSDRWENMPVKEYAAGAPLQVYAGLPGQPPPRLSRSIATKLLNESPLHAWAAHPRLGGHLEEGTAASNGGSLLHQLMLGEGPEVAVCYIHGNKNKIGPLVPAENFLSNEAKAFKKAAVAEGKIPVLERQYTAWMEVKDALLEQIDQETDGLFSESECEVTGLWEESNGVPCKTRLDALHLGRGVILDLKFMRSAHPAFFRSQMTPGGYDMQRHVNVRAVELAHPELAGRIDWQAVVVEVDKNQIPVRIGGRFLISLPVIGGTMRERGRMRWETAVSTWGACLASEKWPAYDCSEPLEARPWEMQNAFDQQLAQQEDPPWMSE